MAIKIRKRVEAEAPAEEKIEALEPEVLPPLGKEGEDSQAENNDNANVKLPGMEDKFLQTSNNMLEKLMEHRRAVTACIVTALVLAFAWIGIHYFIEQSAINKSAFMNQAFVTYTALTTAQTEEIEAARLEYMKSQGIAADAPDILRFSYSVPSEKQRYAAISKYLKSEVTAVAQENIGKTAQLMLAGSDAKLLDNANAETAYNAAATSEIQDVRLFAELGQIELFIGAKKYDQALAKLDELMVNNPSFSSYATLEKGRIYEIQGATDNAIKAYDQVINTFGQPADQDIARARLRYLTADWASHDKKVAPIPSAQAAL